jgi:hypothetical protein
MFLRRGWRFPVPAAARGHGSAKFHIFLHLPSFKAFLSHLLPLFTAFQGTKSTEGDASGRPEPGTRRYLDRIACFLEN